MFKKVWDKTLDILFPQICLGCRKYLENTKDRELLICNACFNNIKLYGNHFMLDVITRLFVLASYDSISMRSLIHHLKYKNIVGVVKPIEKLLDTYLENVDLKNILPPNIIVIPIPLHKSKERKRGFNQSVLIAQIISRKFGYSLNDKLIKRIKKTRSQTSLKTDSARANNVKDCFRTQWDLKDRSVLLVDDVYTSGSTIKEAVKTLQRVGAKEINVFVLAKAGHR